MAWSLCSKTTKLCSMAATLLSPPSRPHQHPTPSQTMHVLAIAPCDPAAAVWSSRVSSRFKSLITSTSYLHKASKPHTRTHQHLRPHCNAWWLHSNCQINVTVDHQILRRRSDVRCICNLAPSPKQLLHGDQRLEGSLVQTPRALQKLHDLPMSAASLDAA